MFLYIIFNILYRLKTAFSLKSQYPYLEKPKEFPYSSFGIGGIFFPPFSSLHRPLLCSLYREKVKNESQRGHRKAWTPYHESKKKTTDLTCQHTHIHTPHAHTIFPPPPPPFISSFLYGNPKSTSPHHLVLVLLSTTSYPTFFFVHLPPLSHLLYIITSLHRSILPHGKHEGASVRTWILGARTLPHAWLQAFTPSCSQAGQQ